MRHLSIPTLHRHRPYTQLSTLCMLYAKWFKFSRTFFFTYDLRGIMMCVRLFGSIVPTFHDFTFALSLFLSRKRKKCTSAQTNHEDPYLFIYIYRFLLNVLWGGCGLKNINLMNSWRPRQFFHANVRDTDKSARKRVFYFIFHTLFFLLLLVKCIMLPCIY